MSTSGTIRGAVAPHISGANKAADQLTKIAKGLLCIPSLLSSFLNPAKILRGFSANIGEIGGIIGGIVQSTVTSELDRLSGYVNSFIADKLAAIKEISDAVKSVFDLIAGFLGGIKESVEFAKSQENCIYNASQLLSCITKEATAGITNKTSNAIRENISPYVNAVGDKLSSVDGAIAGSIQRASDDVKFMQASQSFIKNIQ